jgi:hypothetical protein
LKSTVGCDTSATLVLTVSPLFTTNTPITVCANQLPYIWKGKSYSAAGTYVDTLKSTVGCDTSATLVLTVSPLFTTKTPVTV